MKSRGKIYAPKELIIQPVSKLDMKDNLIRWMKESKQLDFTVTFTATIQELLPGGRVVLSPLQELNESIVTMETWYKKRTLTQINTLKALEAFLFWAHEGEYPQKSDQLWAIHEGIIEEADIRDPQTQVRIRTSSPVCTTEHMNRYIEIALNHLAEAQITDDLRSKIFSDQPLSVLFTSWIKTRMVEKDIDDIKSWAEYKERFRYCEATFMYTDDLVQAHIVSRGANAAAIDEPWNWIRLRNDVHMLQHQHGWDKILFEYPHLIPKVQRARAKAGAKDPQ
jgi:hypothetical protein